MKGLSSSLLALAVAMPFAAPIPAFAQDDFVLDEIVVSALRTAVERFRAGVSVSVIEAEDIDTARDTSLAQTLSRLPGVSVVTSGPFGNTSNLRIRGADGRYLAVIVDGIRVSDPSGTTVSYDWGGLTPAGIGRIEVLRGSQSALWGGSAVGGVINITSRGAIEEGTHQTVAVEAGSYGTGKLTYGLTQKSGGTELAFTASSVRTQGFSAAGGGAEDDGAQANRLSFSIRHQVSDTLAVGGAVFASDLTQEFDGYGPICPPGLPVWITSCLNDVAGNQQDKREVGLRTFAELSLGSTTHEFEVSHLDVERTYLEGGFTSGYTGRRLALGWRATTESSEALSFVYGLDWSRETARYTNLPSGEAATELLGGFAQVLWSPSDAFDLSTTLRHDANSGFGGFTSGRVALAWRPSEGTTLRAAYATGFRAPSIDERFGSYGSFAGNPALDPEESQSFELGVEQTFESGASLSATLFQLEVDNLVTYRYLVPVSTLENLPGASVRKGLELAANLPLSDRVALGLAYTYTDGRRPDGARLTQVPYHVLDLALNAQLSDRLAGQLSVKHVAGRVDNDANTFDVVAMPDYTLLNAQISYDLSDRTEAYLKVENLLDKDYQVVQGYGAPGRSVFLGIQSKF